MLQINQLQLPVDHTDQQLRVALVDFLKLASEASLEFTVKQRAIDARRGHVAFSYTLLATVPDEKEILQRFRNNPRVAPATDETYRHLPSLPAHLPPARPVIIGAGPCGLFCGLLLARAGWRPILLERGKSAGDRARDVTGFWRRGWAFNPESNVQYGEGGAGTFSDGKLYTQIRDREHRIPWLLKEMVAAGAPEDILTKAKPHIGTDRLIKVVRHLREEIIALGGEVRFQSKVTDLRLENREMKAVGLSDGTWIESTHFIFAIGHSARDTFEMLHRNGLPFEPKPFSIGVRIEHPQSLIDRIRYGKWAGHSALGSAPYKFVAHCSTGRSSYSFCMCPGGLVVAACSEPGGVVTNGMSSYARAEANANSGFMVDVGPSDFHADSDNPLGGIEFQRKLERRAFEIAGSSYAAPAQLLSDFIAGRPSTGQGSVQPSYQPGVVWTDLRECLPGSVVATLIESIGRVNQSLPGFSLEDAVLTGVETRSSAPVRIPRDPSSFECVGIKGFFPAGEGAGYAGGIISAAADGMKIAEALLRR